MNSDKKVNDQQVVTKEYVDSRITTIGKNMQILRDECKSLEAEHKEITSKLALIQERNSSIVDKVKKELIYFDQKIEAKFDKMRNELTSSILMFMVVQGAIFILLLIIMLKII